MLNPHPPLTGFPLVLLTLVFVSELVHSSGKSERAREFAHQLLLIAAVVTPLTYFSGYWGADFANGNFRVSNDLIANHQSFGKLGLVALIVSLVFSFLEQQATNGKVMIRQVYLLLVATTFGLIAYTGFLGGELVFSHGAGVHVKPQ